MTCSRCQGFMAQDHCLDMEGSYGPMWATSWRCVNCGRLHDSVIEQNRLSREEKVLALPREEPKFQDPEVHFGVEAIIGLAAEEIWPCDPLIPMRNTRSGVTSDPLRFDGETA